MISSVVVHFRLTFRLHAIKQTSVQDDATQIPMLFFSLHYERLPVTHEPACKTEGAE